MRQKNSLWIIVLCTVLFSCSEQPHFEKAFSFEAREWSQDVKPVYEIEIDDVATEYDFTLSLRTSTDYKYSNLWVFMKTETPDGTIAREPFEIKITNPDGSWIGDKSGSTVTTSLYFRRRQLPIKGTYTFTLEQGITASKIDEVHDLIFRVEKAKTEI